MNVTIEIPMPRLASVKAAGGLRVQVTWKQGLRTQRTDVVDLSPLIGSLKFYKPLRDDATLFETIHLVDLGSAIAWGDGEIDLAATSIERLAEETFTGSDLRCFLKTNQLTHEQAAAQLGYTRRQIEYFLNGDHPIPRVVVLACYGYAARRLQVQPRTTIVGGSRVTIDDRSGLTETEAPPKRAPLISERATA